MAAPDTGQENATTIKLTQEDVEKIKSLPKRTFLIGNLQQNFLQMRLKKIRSFIMRGIILG